MTTEIRQEEGRTRPRVVKICRGGRTVQDFTAETDINYIVSRIKSGKPVPQLAREAMYGDFSNAGDFQAAQEAVVRGREAFKSLPAEVRAAFNHNPRELLEALDQGVALEGDSRKVLEKCGMIAPLPEPPPEPEPEPSPPPVE